jgi:hypothetical protein
VGSQLPSVLGRESTRIHLFYRFTSTEFRCEVHVSYATPTFKPAWDVSYAQVDTQMAARTDHTASASGLFPIQASRCCLLFSPALTQNCLPNTNDNSE